MLLSALAERMKPQGVMFTSDPNRSPLRFIFDFLMRIWKLYDEEAGHEPLIARAQLNQWLGAAGMNGRIWISTYLPPHALYLLSKKTNVVLLKVSDGFFNSLPVVRNWGGVIIAEGKKGS